MWNLLLILIISGGLRFSIEGNRTISDSLILNKISNLEVTDDSTLAEAIINLYLEYGFPFVRVKFQKSRDTLYIFIKEGPLARINGVEIKPEEFKTVKQLIPSMKGRIFSPSIVSLIKERINSTGYLRLDGIGFIKKHDGIYLVAKVRKVTNPSFLLLSMSASNRKVTGFSRLTFKSIFGRPGLFSLIYNQVKQGERELKIFISFPFVHGSPFGIYGGYSNRLYGQGFSIDYRAGYLFNSGHLSISNGFLVNESGNGRMVFGELQTEGSVLNRRISFSSYIAYRANRYRVTLKTVALWPPLTLRAYLFEAKDFEAEKLGGPYYFHGFDYGFATATDGYILENDLRLYKWLHAFFTAGKIESNQYISYGIIIDTGKGKIYYGVHPGIAPYDGILTIALKIGF